MSENCEHIVRTLAEGMVLTMERVQHLEMKTKYLEEYNERTNKTIELLTQTNNLLYEKIKNLYNELNEIKIKSKSKSKKKNEQTEEVGDVLKYLLSK